MATIVQDFGESKDKILFKGSSDEDRGYAKIFWQSVQLLPPMESRLVSSNINQRLKVAPPAHQPVNVAYQEREDPAELRKFLEKAEAMQRADEVKRLDQFSKLRQEDLQLLQKHRSQRLEKEKLSSAAVGRRKLKDEVTKAMEEAQNQEYYDDEQEKQQALRDIEQFEKNLGQNDADEDSD